HHEVGMDAGLHHGLADRHELPRVADAELETDRLAAGELAQLNDEMHHLDRRLEGRMRGRRDAVDADRNAARLGDLGRHLGAGQPAAVPGLGPWRQLDLDHFPLRLLRLLGEALGAEAAVVVAAAEIAAAELPDQVTAILAVIAADAALAGVVGEAAELG